MDFEALYQREPAFIAKTKVGADVLIEELQRAMGNRF
jgi:hypothetical protein